MAPLFKRSSSESKFPPCRHTDFGCFFFFLVSSQGAHGNLHRQTRLYSKFILKYLAPVLHAAKRCSCFQQTKAWLFGAWIKWKKQVGVCGKEQDDSFSGKSQTHTSILKMKRSAKISNVTIMLITIVKTLRQVASSCLLASYNIKTTRQVAPSSALSHVRKFKSCYFPVRRL